MTAAQKAAKEKFKKAIAYRKKTGCTLKQAFAHVYGKKSVGAVKKKAATKKKAAPKKKAVVKKKAAPKKKAVSYHKDTKSHNVRINVVSGINKVNIIDDLKQIEKKIQLCENVISQNKIKMKQFVYKTPFWKSFFRKRNNEVRKIMNNLKKQKTLIKSNI
jgi:hypothetical protein